MKSKKAESGSKKTKKLVLGRGLDALLPDIEPMEDIPKEYFTCDIGLIQPNRYQPRLRFSDNELEEMARSIHQQGIIQPLLVRKDSNGYELIAGERRLRAAKKAGLKQVPVLVKTITDIDMLEMSIVENVQRSDLNPIEEAEAYHRLITEFGLTQDQAAERVGKSRSAVANFLRLRQLPEQIKTSIMDGALSMGHARALLGTATSAQLNAVFKTVISKGLSVRETERLIKRLKAEKERPKKPISSSEQRYFSDLADDLSGRFGTKVQIKKRGQKGKVEIEFYSNDDLDRLLSLLKQI
ncbi:MAG: ParB/RepB/Spo0J family partition protein [Desulfobacteraceae bacterium]|nr:ParB/RepB/Spo0J family partition protein [Desulfobacteraceae bacterium]MDH3572933.1 ParB/RepB/Spo0J family partition protein [Desulfobacteraceae bacterium]MDH3719883.1 ParB/RepB/Spo0J family partition protein [Desulfobacteraceae bacterium]MDH3836325.1 ParB/RepB/Spo0J family partition protein [Desulfobacteraceae bacterium]MDH3873609.1 ParB/RepB/Spo0J family partition protein [Desulfobacteraceae bacterium]